MSVKEVLIQDRVIVGESLRQPAQAGGRDLLEGRLVRLKPDLSNMYFQRIISKDNLIMTDIHTSRT